MLENTETTVPILRHRNESDRVGVLGGRTRFPVTPQEVGDAYAILEQVIPAQHGPPLHGEFEITIGDQVVRAGPGSSACYETARCAYPRAKVGVQCRAGAHASSKSRMISSLSGRVWQART